MFRRHTHLCYSEQRLPAWTYTETQTRQSNRRTNRTSQTNDKQRIENTFPGPGLGYWRCTQRGTRISTDRSINQPGPQSGSRPAPASRRLPPPVVRLSTDSCTEPRERRLKIQPPATADRAARSTLCTARVREGEGGTEDHPCSQGRAGPGPRLAEQGVMWGEGRLSRGCSTGGGRGGFGGGRGQESHLREE